MKRALALWLLIFSVIGLLVAVYVLLYSAGRPSLPLNKPTYREFLLGQRPDTTADTIKKAHP